MTLSVSVQLIAGALGIEAAFSAPPGRTVAVLGPNGAGKTTVLRAIAGLVPLRAGRVTLGDDVLEDTTRGVSVPTERRSLGVVFQDYLLFPHLSVLDNIAYGPRARGRSASAAQDAARTWLARLGLSAREGARPSALSGGEAQRVALARALASEPRALLLDEPLAALDVTTRASVRRELRTHLAGFAGPRVLITHDPVDALTLADAVVVMERGRVVQQGDVREVAARPRSDFVADLMGTNLFRGRAGGGTLTLPDGAAIAIPDRGEGERFATIRPSAISLYRARPEGSPRNVFAGTVAAVECAGERCRVRLEGALPLVVEVTPSAVHELGLVEGASVWASFKATEIATYP